MAFKQVFIGSRGPFLFDDEDTYEDGQVHSPGYSPDAPFVGQNIVTTDLTTNVRLVASNAERKLEEVNDLSVWVKQGTGGVTVTNNADGTVTLNLGSHEHDAADIVSGALSDARLPSTQNGKTFVSDVRITDHTDADGAEGNKLILGKSTGPYIAQIQQGADNDAQGIVFYTHPSAVAVDPPELAMTLNKNKHLNVVGNVTGANLAIANWNTAYSDSVVGFGRDVTTSGRLNIVRRGSTDLSTRLASIQIGDARQTSNFPNSDGTVDYMPAPNDTQFNRGVTPVFSGDWPGGTWGGFLTVKGWSGDYSAWQIVGDANSGPTTDVNEWYLRRGDTATWGSWFKIWHDGNFDPATKADISHTHPASDIVSGTFADARIAESNVTQHQAAITITESQISDLGPYDNYVSFTIKVDSGVGDTVTSGQAIDFIGGTNITLSRVGRQVTINASAATEGPKVKAKTSGQFSSSGVTPDVVTWEAEDFDSNGMHDNTTNNSRLTVPIGHAGLYLVVARIDFDVDLDTISDGTIFWVYLYKNGVEFSEAAKLVTGAQEPLTFHTTELMQLAESDYIEVFTAWEGTASSIFIGDDSRFEAVKIRS